MDNNSMYPTHRAIGGMDSVSGKVCRRHGGYLQRKWSGDYDE